MTISVALACAAAKGVTVSGPMDGALELREDGRLVLDKRDSVIKGPRNLKQKHDAELQGLLRCTGSRVTARRETENPSGSIGLCKGR